MDSDMILIAAMLLFLAFIVVNVLLATLSFKIYSEFVKYRILTPSERTPLRAAKVTTTSHPGFPTEEDLKV